VFLVASGNPSGSSNGGGGSKDDQPAADNLYFGKLAITSDEARTLSPAAIVQRLIDGGTSRLTAMRMVELERGKDEPGRARPHGQSRR